MVKTYNPKKVTCVLGKHIVTGYADDSMITVEYAGDGTSHISGADGEIVRSIDPSDAYTIKLVVQQTSDTNKYLNKMFEMDKKNSNGLFAVNINDILGKEKFVCESAWVKKPASFVRGKSAQNREWEVVCGKGEFK